MATLGVGSDIDGANISNIGEVISLGIVISADSIDATQTTKAYQQSIPSTINAGVISVSLFYDGSNGAEAEDFIAELKKKRISLWTIDFAGGTGPSNGRFQSLGYVTSAAITASVASVITMAITIQLTDEPKFNGE